MLMPHQIVFILAILVASSAATIYFVDGNSGSDDNHGDEVYRPFKTIQRCADALKNPGDECQIRSGRYHEEVHISGLVGTAENPLKIKGFADEVPIWDGTVSIKPQSWNHDIYTGICTAEIEQDIFALFLNDDLLTPARWPNALWSDRSIFSNRHWRHPSHESTRGTIVDPALEDSGLNVTGAMAVLNVGSWITYVREVLEHEAGSDRFTYHDDFGNIHWRPNHNQYYLESSLSLLDAPEEWYYDMKTKVLHMISPNGTEGCPNDDASLRGRTMDYGLTVDSTQHLIVANISFFAANIDVHGVNEVTIDSLQFKFPSSSHRMLKSTSHPKNTRVVAASHKKISVINCTFEGAEGPALEYSGQNTYIHNNEFSYVDWTGQGNVGTVMDHATNGEFSHNTLWYNGNAHGLRYTGRHGTMKFNHIAGQCWGNIQSDGAGMQISTGAQNGIRISHNWVYDSPKKGLRFDGDGHPLGIHGYQGFNVVWNIHGNTEMYVKGDNHTVESNLSYDDDDDTHCTLCVPSQHGDASMNKHSIVINNAANKMASGGGLIENNYNALDVKNHLVDPNVQDFRPIDGGPLTEGEVVMGPYQPGLGDLNYWIPGRKIYKTSYPIPPSGATVPQTRDVVMCRGGFMADKHNFYFGTAKENVENAGMDDEEFQFTLDEGNIFELSPLESNTSYFWRVDTQTMGHIFKGDVWNFVTNNN